MGIYFGGVEYSEVHFGGFEQNKVLNGTSEYHEGTFEPTLFVIGMVNAAGVITSMRATLQDRNPIMSVDAVRFDVIRAGVSRLFHTGFRVSTLLPATLARIEDTGLADGVTARTTDSLRVRVTYTDTTGQHTITQTAVAFSVEDTPGMLTIAFSRSGRNRDLQFTLTDVDGIRSITTATLTASDGQAVSILDDLSRTSANVFSGTNRRRQARWNSGALRVVYVDTRSGESRTLVQTWP